MCADRVVARFSTAREVIKADAECRNVGLNVRVIATPERLTSECGMSLEIDAIDRERFMELMNLKLFKVRLYDDTPSV